MKLWKKEIKLLLILFKFLIEIILIFIFEIVKKYLITKNIKKRIIILVLNQINIIHLLFNFKII